jgi:hypothetical protein
MGQERNKAGVKLGNAASRRCNQIASRDLCRASLGFLADVRSKAEAAAEYVRLLKEGVQSKATQYLEKLAEENPRLAHAVKVMADSLPELVEGLTAEMKDAAPGLALDAAIAIGGALLSGVSGGTSLAITVTKTLHRIDQLRRFATSATEAIVKIGEGYDSVEGLITDARASIIDDLAKLLGKAVGKAARGIEDSSVQKALGKAMLKADQAVVAFTDGLTKKSKLMTAIGHMIMRHVDLAERITGYVLEYSGLFETENVPGIEKKAIGPIQNYSGHGIDYVARARTGAYTGQFVGFAIKAGLFKVAPSLQGDERSGAHAFMTSRIDRAISKWQKAPAGTKEFAEYVDKQMFRKTYDGFVVRHDYIGKKGSEAVTFRDWK